MGESFALRQKTGPRSGEGSGQAQGYRPYSQFQRNGILGVLTHMVSPLGGVVEVLSKELVEVHGW